MKRMLTYMHMLLLTLIGGLGPCDLGSRLKCNLLVALILVLSPSIVQADVRMQCQAYQQIRTAPYPNGTLYKADASGVVYGVAQVDILYLLQTSPACTLLGGGIVSSVVGSGALSCSPTSGAVVCTASGGGGGSYVTSIYTSNVATLLLPATNLLLEVIRQGTPAPLTVNLPATPSTNLVSCVKDGGNNFSSNPATVKTIDGTVIDAVVGTVGIVMNQNRQVLCFIFDGTQWNIN